MDSRPASRPTVTVHMGSSIDGRIQTRRWGGFDLGTLYEDVHAELAGNAWMCGRISMQGYTRGTAEDDTDDTPVPRTDHLARRDAKTYAVALDARGVLHWGTRSSIDDDHVIVVLSEAVSDAHLNSLRRNGQSYVFGGRDGIDFARVLATLKREFGIERLLVEGGGSINGSLLAARCVDAISLLLVPVIDGTRGIPAVFDRDDPRDMPPDHGAELRLTGCEPQPNGVVRLRYDVTYGVSA